MESVKDNIKKGLHTEALDADGNKVIIKRTWFNFRNLLFNKIYKSIYC